MIATGSTYQRMELAHMGAARWSIVENRIVVETLIRAPIDVVWQYTQSPELHERWDLRFSSIEYRPRRSNEEPEQFAYARRLLPGLTIHGTGETVGVRLAADGTATSALRFGSDDLLSLIRRGSGYWKYIPVESGVRFVTGYDYEPGWGAVGRLIDRFLFRRAIAWATARSFDRLRAWIETGVEP